MNTHQRHRSVSIPPYLPLAEKITWDLDDGDGANRKFRRAIFSKTPNLFSKSLANIYRDLYLNKGERDANLFLLEVDEGINPGSFNEGSLNLGASNSSLKEDAKKRVDACFRLTQLPQKYQNDIKSLYKSLAFYADRFLVQAPKVKGGNYQSAILRLLDEQWWRKELRKIHKRKLELFAIKLGSVHRHASLYVSPQTLQCYLVQQQSNKEFMEQVVLENEEGDEFTLQQLMETSVANPRNRRNELMCRCAGFEEFAKKANHIALFLTLTCPSRMHPRYSSTGHANPNYDETSPREANDYFNNIWKNMRSKFGRDGITFYGLRVVEPQHDATPHWHFMFFTEKQFQTTVEDIFRNYALKDSPDEKGADKHRFTSVAIDWSRGSATGYIAKYIAKNIDGAHLDQDLYGNDAADSALRVRAWASTWGIRQFQQFGGPPVSVWRELRRCKNVPEGVLKEAFEAADQGDWQTYVELLGGCNIKVKDIPIKLEKVWSDKLGKYGEPLGYQVVGITDGTNTVTTRIHEWKIKTSPIIPEHTPPKPQAGGCAGLSYLEFCQ